MMLAAPEFVVAKPVELFDEIEIATELQQRMLADRVVRGEKGAKIQTRHNRVLLYMSVIDPDRAGLVNILGPNPRAAHLHIAAIEK
jgi:hypothetical protein